MDNPFCPPARQQSERWSKNKKLRFQVAKFEQTGDYDTTLDCNSSSIMSERTAILSRQGKAKQLNNGSEPTDLQLRSPA